MITPLPLNEIFVSLQGEGIRMGAPSIFVRLSLCNHAEAGHPCKWCDTPYAWKISETDRLLSDEEIINEVEIMHLKTGIKDVVITGGEPLHHKTEDLIRYCSKHYNLTVETNGSLPIWLESCLWSISFKGPLSGNQDYNDYENIKYLNYNSQLKFVIGNKEDYIWAKKIINNYACLTNILFQPAYKLMSPNKLANWIMNDKELSWHVRLGMQMQKIWWKPGRRGV